MAPILESKTLGKAGAQPSKRNEEGGVIWETRGDKTLERTHHPTKGSKQERNGRQDPREGGHIIQPRKTRRGTSEHNTQGRRTHHPTKGNKQGHHWRQKEIRGDKTPGPRAGTPSNKGKQAGVQWETIGGKTLNRRTHQASRGAMGDKKRQDPRNGSQDFGKADTIQEGVRWESRPSTSRTHQSRPLTRTIQEPWEGGRRNTMRLKTLEKADTPSKNAGSQDSQEGRHNIQEGHNGGQDPPVGFGGRLGTKGIKKVYSASQDLREGGHTIQCGQEGVKKGYKGSQYPQEGRHTIQEGVQWESRPSREDTQSKKWYNWSQEGVQWEPRPSRRRTHHPRRGTTGVKKGYNGSQGPREGGHTIQEGVHWEQTHHPRRGTKGVKTLGRRTHHPRSGTRGAKTLEEDHPRRGTVGAKKGYIGSQAFQKGGHTISRRGRTMKVKTIEEADAPKKGAQWKSRSSKRRTHHPRRGTEGVKKGHKGSQDLREGRHTIQTKGIKKRYNGSQDPWEARPTFQEWAQRESKPSRRRTHQGRHLKKAVRTPNSILFGEKMPQHPSPKYRSPTVEQLTDYKERIRNLQGSSQDQDSCTPMAKLGNTCI